MEKAIYNKFLLQRLPMKLINSLPLALVVTFSLACFGSPPISGSSDSTASKEGFNQYSGLKAESNAKDIHYHFQGFQDHLMYMKFKAENPIVVQTIIKKHGLKPTEITDTLHNSYASWWNLKDLETSATYVSNTHSHFKRLWLAGNTVFILDFSL